MRRIRFNSVSGTRSHFVLSDAVFRCLACVVPFPGMETYWSIAKRIVGLEPCGEACVDPKKESLFVFLEHKLTKANFAVAPCLIRFRPS